MSHAAEFDEYGHNSDHGHVIVSLFTLRFILIALLFCTLLTSSTACGRAARREHLPRRDPAVDQRRGLLLSIAVVKTALVVGFFMQLKYDNPMNTVIFVFTLVTVFSFLGFTSLDLGNRASDRSIQERLRLPRRQPLCGWCRHTRQWPTATRSPPTAQATGKPSHREHHETSNTQSITDAGFLREEPATGSSPRTSAAPSVASRSPAGPGTTRPKQPTPSTPPPPASTKPRRPRCCSQSNSGRQARSQARRGPRSQARPLIPPVTRPMERGRRYAWCITISAGRRFAAIVPMARRIADYNAHANIPTFHAEPIAGRTLRVDGFPIATLTDVEPAKETSRDTGKRC